MIPCRYHTVGIWYLTVAPARCGGDTARYKTRLSLATRSLLAKREWIHPARPPLHSPPSSVPFASSRRNFRRLSLQARRFAAHPNAHDWTRGHAPPNSAHLRSTADISSQPPCSPMLVFIIVVELGRHEGGRGGERGGGGGGGACGT